MMQRSQGRNLDLEVDEKSVLAVNRTSPPPERSPARSQDAERIACRKGRWAVRLSQRWLWLLAVVALLVAFGIVISLLD